MIRVVIEGASGYSGMELTKLLARHPEIDLVGLSSSRWAGRTVREELGLPGPAGALVYRAELDPEADAVLLATPPDFSRERVPQWLDAGARVVDLSHAYRADELAVYGLTEHYREALEGARLVANPGCYPTAALLALLPLVKAGLLADGAVLLDGKSGATGAGRKLTDALLFNELAHNHYPYRVGHHQHVPEMERNLERPVLFTPHLLPTRRGLLISAVAPVVDGVGPEAVRDCLVEAYEGEPFVQVVDPGEALGLNRVVHTPNCRVAAAPVVKAGYARVFGSLDNLLKGAASQAIQNLNRILGLEESLGIVP